MDREQRVYSPFATYIRRRRLALGLTQEQVARRCGEDVSGSYIAKLERDTVETPPPTRIRKLAHALEVPTTDLGVLIYHDAGEPLPAPPPPRPVPVIDPADVRELTALLRLRLPTAPIETLEAQAYMLLSLERLTREDFERRHGPSKALPPPDGQERGAG